MFKLKQCFRRILVPALDSWTRDFVLFDDVIIYSLVDCLLPILLLQTKGRAGRYHCSGRRWSGTALLCRLCWYLTSLLQHRLLMVMKSQVCCFFVWLNHTADCNMKVGLNHCIGSVRVAGLYHSADCIECGIETNCLSLGGLHVGVIHWVFKGCLTIGALMANIAIELDLWTCPEKQKKNEGTLC